MTPIRPLSRTWIGRSTARLDSPLVPAAFLFVLASSFTVARLALVARGNLSSFILAGSQFANAAKVPHGLTVFPGSGFDGEFYYRMALAPFNFSRTAFGIVDYPYRFGRIGYPFLAWIVSLGQAALVPFALVAVNVAALTFSGYVAGKWARSLGRHALWGLLPAGYFGLVWSLGRDLTEITSMAFLVAGIVAWRNRHFWLAGLSLGGAVLSRESSMVVVVALAITRAIDVMRRRERFGRTDAAWIIPTLAYGAWELIVRVAGGRFPLLSNRTNLALPFVGIYDGVRSWFAHPLPDQSLQFAQLAALVLISALAFWNLQRSTSSGFEKLSFVFAAVLTVTLSSNVWANDPHIFRTMVEMFVLGSGILLGAPKFRLILLTCAMWGVWLLVAQYNLSNP